MVRTAPFKQRPDSIKAGSQLGPFDGQVLDADTDQPVEGALVWCSWSFTRGIGSQAPETSRSAEGTTDADGRYHIPALRSYPWGLSTRLARFSLIVYKKGYVAYRHDRIFNQRRRRKDFSQFNNTISLSRWSPELSHTNHLLFIGGGPSLAKASQWEVLAAVAELEGKTVKRPLAADFSPLPRTPAIGIKPRELDASVLLTSDDVRSITGYTGRFREGRLAGASTESYDTFHLRAVDRPERYDVAIRLWRLEEDDLTAKYEETLNSLPGSKQTDKVADRSFTVVQGEILGLGFMDRSASVLVLLTCGKGQCSKGEHLHQLAKKLEQNLNRLSRGATKRP